MDRTDMLVAEWKEVRETLRYFGNKRFAQLTVFIAATGFMVNVFFQQTDPDRRWVLGVGGALLSLAFLVMESSSVNYWKAFVRRAENIEQDESIPLELMTKFRPGSGRLLSGTNATYILYFVVFAGWLLSLVKR